MHTARTMDHGKNNQQAQGHMRYEDFLISKAQQFK